jgi:hypothetical protein
MFIKQLLELPQGAWAYGEPNERVVLPAPVTAQALGFSHGGKELGVKATSLNRML